jgi:arylsulfatase A-like enzyme
VRSRNWRYIRYADGAEELYDHRNDPGELENLAGDPDHAAVKAELAKWIPADAGAAPEVKPWKTREQVRAGREVAQP